MGVYRLPTASRTASTIPARVVASRRRVRKLSFIRARASWARIFMCFLFAPSGTAMRNTKRTGLLSGLRQSTPSPGIRANNTVGVATPATRACGIATSFPTAVVVCFSRVNAAWITASPSVIRPTDTARSTKPRMMSSQSPEGALSSRTTSDSSIR